MPWVMYSLVFGSTAMAALAGYPTLLRKGNEYFTRRVSEAGLQLEDMFMDVSKRRLMLFYVLTPVILGFLGLTLKSTWGALIGVVVGLIVPKFVLQRLRAIRYKKFHEQLVETLLQISSCLRAGLSMIQAFSVVVEEMPRPASDEFGLILKESRMGVPLDGAMLHFKERMPSDDTNLFVTTVLVARETGGDVTAVFTQLVETLRERRKVKERVRTLTFMPRMQALIMVFIPIIFMYVTYATDPGHVQFFMTDPLGKVLLAGMIMVQFFSWYLFLRFSRSPL